MPRGCEGARVSSWRTAIVQSGGSGDDASETIRRDNERWTHPGRCCQSSWYVIHANRWRNRETGSRICERGQRYGHDRVRGVQKAVPVLHKDPWCGLSWPGVTIPKPKSEFRVGRSEGRKVNSKRQNPSRCRGNANAKGTLTNLSCLNLTWNPTGFLGL